MNRVEFMETLSRLLQDIPEEDRIDALKYYNDYFDDAEWVPTLVLRLRHGLCRWVIM